MANRSRTAKVPVSSSEAITKSMKSNKSKGTNPELIVRKQLRESGYPGYRLNWKKAPGKPDICYPGKKIAIFVNGCFWHRCPKCNLPLPKSNLDYWKPKFDRNVERDAKEIESLEKGNWTVVVVWECEIKSGPDAYMPRILSSLKGRSVSNS